MTLTLTTNTHNELELEISTPRGSKIWHFVMAKEGPELSSGPPPSPAAEKTAETVWRWMHDAEREARQRETDEIFRQHLDLDLRALGKALLYDVPGIRQDIERLAKYHHRQALDPLTSPPSRERMMAFSAQLNVLLRRYAPAKSVNEEGPTLATVANQQPDPLEALVQRNLLSLQQQAAASEVRAILRALIAKLDAKGANYQMGRVETVNQYLHPIETLPAHLHQPYQDRYVGWSKDMAQVPWYAVSWAQNGSQALDMLCRAQSPVTLWNAVYDVLGLNNSTSQVEANYRLPADHASLMLRAALARYPR